MIVWLITWSLGDGRSIAEANILWFHVVSKLISLSFGWLIGRNSFSANDRYIQICKFTIFTILQKVSYTLHNYMSWLYVRKGEDCWAKMATKPETTVQDSVLTFDLCIVHWVFQPLPSVKPRHVKTYSSCVSGNKNRYFRWDDEFVCGDRPRLAKTCFFSDPNRVVFVPRSN